MFKLDFNKGLLLLLIITTLSGALRKWLGLPSALNNIFVGLILLIPTLLIFIKPDYKHEQSSKGIFNIYIFLLIIFAVNPLNHTLYHGLFGIMVHLLFFGILWAYQKNKEFFLSEKFISTSLILFAIQIIIGSIQYSSPGDGFINRYAVDEESTAGAALVGDAVRVTGTFSYIAGYGAFIFLALFASFYLIKKEIYPKYNFLILISVFYGSLLSGSRGTVGFVGLTIIMFFLFETKSFFNSKAIFNTFIAGVIFLFANTLFGDPIDIYDRVERSYDNFMLRFENSSEEGESRLTEDIYEAFDGKYEYGLTGIGLGSTYQGANILFGQSPQAASIFYEGELFRTVIEGGYLLLLLRFILLFVLIKKLNFSVGFKVYLFLIISLYCSIVFNIYGAIFLAMGLILLSHAREPETTKIEQNT
ncbi:hypothetical protein [Pedobacter glucosidilyticus]|uniref:hypothetical protein n=1 Tax=Pedobacter glucosidilyticus TaxID=1122941 RepID=UPI000415BE1D|nr:hypothetical protein [Pedobacter glucosidilyticus]